MAPELLKYLTQIEPNAVFSNGLQPSTFQSSSGTRYFAKLGKPSESEQYFGEAESLRAIALAAPGLAPKVFACGADSGYNLPYFISEYKDLDPLTDVAARSLAKRLATELHMYKSTHGFGFEVPTYCGRTRLENGWFDTWEHCFDNLIAGLLSGLRAKAKYVELVRKGEEVRKV
jgi:protein-ribulosamine 3-kinase